MDRIERPSHNSNFHKQLLMEGLFFSYHPYLLCKKYNFLSDYLNYFRSGSLSQSFSQFSRIVHAVVQDTEQTVCHLRRYQR